MTIQTKPFASLSARLRRLDHEDVAPIVKTIVSEPSKMVGPNRSPALARMPAYLQAHCRVG